MKLFIAYPVGIGVLAACMAGVVWAEPLGNRNFSRLLRISTAGHFKLVEDINLTQPEPNGHSRSPWQPIGFFNGTLEGNGYTICGLNIQESGTDVNSGLFRRQNGTVNLLFIDPEVMATGNGVRQGLVAGENSGNVTVVWQGVTA